MILISHTNQEGGRRTLLVVTALPDERASPGIEGGKRLVRSSDTDDQKVAIEERGSHMVEPVAASTAMMTSSSWLPPGAGRYSV